MPISSSRRGGFELRGQKRLGNNTATTFNHLYYSTSSTSPITVSIPILSSSSIVSTDSPSYRTILLPSVLIDFGQTAALTLISRSPLPPAVETASVGIGQSGTQGSGASSRRREEAVGHGGIGRHGRWSSSEAVELDEAKQ